MVRISGKIWQITVFKSIRHFTTTEQIIWYKRDDTEQLRRYTDKENKNPKPSNLPFHELDNLIMSPHNSSHTLESDIRRAEYMSDNFKAFKKGLDVPGFVFYGTGTKQEV